MIAPLSVPEAPQALPKLPLAGFPVSPQGTYSNTYAFGNCTEYVASRKSIPDSWGNADTWAIRAQAQGIQVSSTPIVGSIAQRSTYPYGHVAIVMGIDGDQVLVSEMNVRGLNAVDEAWYPTSGFNYIYT